MAMPGVIVKVMSDPRRPFRVRLKLSIYSVLVEIELVARLTCVTGFPTGTSASEVLHRNLVTVVPIIIWSPLPNSQVWTCNGNRFGAAEWQSPVPLSVWNQSGRRFNV